MGHLIGRGAGWRGSRVTTAAGAGPLNGAGHGRASRRYALAALVLGLVAAAYGLWHQHGRESAEVGARLIADGEYRAAIRALQRPLAAAPGDARVHYYLGRAYAGAGLLEGAVNQLHEAVRLAPRQALYHAALGQAYREANDPERARAELDEAVRLDPAEPRYEANLAGLLLEQGQTDDALAHLRRAVGRRPREPELRLFLAEALRRAGDREGMAREYREVVRLAGERPLGEAARQELRAALGNDWRGAEPGPASGSPSPQVGTPPGLEAARYRLPD